MTPLKPGDVVTLTCGGPAMTIAGWEDGGPLAGVPGWICHWHVQGTLKRAILPAEALRLAEDDPAKGG